MKVTINVDMEKDDVAKVHELVDRIYAVKATKPAETAKPAVTKPASAPAATIAPSKPKHDRNDVKDALKSLAQLAGKDPAVKILNDNGAASISELAEDKFDAVHAMALAAVAEFPTATVEEDEFA